MASMNVDFPAPGTPLIPTRTAEPVDAVSSRIRAPAASRWSARVDSTSVIARAMCARDPERTACASVGTSTAGAHGRLAPRA
jgi:hypothetical protein